MVTVYMDKDTNTKENSLIKELWGFDKVVYFATEYFGITTEEIKELLGLDILYKIDFARKILSGKEYLNIESIEEDWNNISNGRSYVFEKEGIFYSLEDILYKDLINLKELKNLRESKKREIVSCKEEKETKRSKLKFPTTAFILSVVAIVTSILALILKGI